MKRYRQSLPPLDALVFFESAARHGSFTRAGSELYVSQAAVSKRIRQLEEWFGTELFERSGRVLTLTEAGVQISEKVVMALDYLEVSINSVRRVNRSALRIAANSAVTMFWLQPRLRAFALEKSSCTVGVLTSDRAGDLLSPEHDFTILYAKAPLPGWQMYLLREEVLAPVAAPGLARRMSERAPTIFSEPWQEEAPVLLDYERVAPDWTNWQVWAERLNLPTLRNWPRLNCDSYTLAIGKALAEHGIALGSIALLDGELRSGQLVQIGEKSLKTGHGYYLAHPSGRLLSHDARQLLEFLLDDQS